MEVLGRCEWRSEGAVSAHDRGQGGSLSRTRAGAAFSCASRHGPRLTRVRSTPPARCPVHAPPVSARAACGARRGVGSCEARRGGIRRARRGEGKFEAVRRGAVRPRRKGRRAGALQAAGTDSRSIGADEPPSALYRSGEAGEWGDFRYSYAVFRADHLARCGTSTRHRSTPLPPRAAAVPEYRRRRPSPRIGLPRPPCVTVDPSIAGSRSRKGVKEGRGPPGPWPRLTRARSSPAPPAHARSGLQASGPHGPDPPGLPVHPLGRRAATVRRQRRTCRSRRGCGVRTSSGAKEWSMAARARSATPVSSRWRRRAATPYSRFRVVPNIGGSSRVDR